MTNKRIISSEIQVKNITTSAPYEEVDKYCEYRIPVVVTQKIQERFDVIEPQIKKAVDDATKDAIEKVLKEVTEVRNSVVGTLALFAAFFTFVSVDVVVLKDQADQKIGLFAKIGVILVICFCLMGFIFTFFLFLRERERNWPSWVPILITFALALGTFPIMKAFDTF